MPRRSTADPEELCRRTAAAQQGVFSYRQARAAGLSKQGIARRVRAGRFEPVLAGVFAIRGAPQTWRRQLMAAILWGGPGAAASHRAAAALHALGGFAPGVIEISLTRRKHCRDGTIRVHACDEQLSSEIVDLDGIPVTSIRRTLLDVAACSPSRAESALEDALRKRLTSVDEMSLFLEQQWLVGRRGTGRMRALLLGRTPGMAATHSDLELMLERIIARSDLPKPERQYAITVPSGVIHVDFAYPGARLALEADGYAWHSDRKAFERDRLRDIELQSLGWKVLRFTSAVMRWRASYVVETIRANLWPRLYLGDRIA